MHMCACPSTDLTIPTHYSARTWLAHRFIMRCINCGVATQRLRRHFTSSLPRLQLTILAGWLTTEVPMDANICHPCFELLSLETAAGNIRLFGHTLICITCGRSVRSVQQHAVERDSSMLQDLPKSHPAFYQVMKYACHACWIKHHRQSNQNQIQFIELEPKLEPGLSFESEQGHSPETEQRFSPEPEQRLSPELEQGHSPQPEQKIDLPTYKRAANTSTHCVFYGCAFLQQLHVIPGHIKKMFIVKHNFYVPRSTRVCETHLNLDVWHTLLQNDNLFSNFTANQIEDLISIAKTEK